MPSLGISIGFGSRLSNPGRKGRSLRHFPEVLKEDALFILVIFF